MQSQRATWLVWAIVTCVTIACVAYSVTNPSSNLLAWTRGHYFLLQLTPVLLLLVAFGILAWRRGGWSGLKSLPSDMAQAKTSNWVWRNFVIRIAMLALVAVAYLVFHRQPGETNQAQVAQAATALRNGDSKKSLSILTPLAQKGDSAAQNLLGTLYESGRGVPQDPAKGLYWESLSAAQGNIAAEDNLGTIYLQGRGTPVDYGKAAHWFLMAAQRGLPRAQNALGIMAAKGEGMPVDMPRAYMWFSVAAGNGGPAAVANRDRARNKLSAADFDKATQMIARCTGSKYRNCG